MAPEAEFPAPVQGRVSADQPDETWPVRGSFRIQYLYAVRKQAFASARHGNSRSISRP